MPRLSKTNKRSRRVGATTKYDAHHTVLDKTYGALADLRRELADSKTLVAEREELLRIFADCADSQRAWLLLEDYFEKLSLSRRDFSGPDWWPRMLRTTGSARLEELAILFLRANRPLPSELTAYASAQRFAEITQAEQEQYAFQEMEHWLFPPAPAHLDSPRAVLRVLCELRPEASAPGCHAFVARLSLYRPRSGERVRPLTEILELTRRAAHEQELFSPGDWAFMQWLAETYPDPEPGCESLVLTGAVLLYWLARWGQEKRLECAGHPLHFSGELLTLAPHLEEGELRLLCSRGVGLPNGICRPFQQARLLAGPRPLVLLENTVYVLNNPPPPLVVAHWSRTPALPLRLLSERLQLELRKSNKSAARQDDRASRRPAEPVDVDGWLPVAQAVEEWLLPAGSAACPAAARLPAITSVQPARDYPALHELALQIAATLSGPVRKQRAPARWLDLIRRVGTKDAASTPEEHRFFRWLEATCPREELDREVLVLSGMRLLQWLTHWGGHPQWHLDGTPVRFVGQVVSLTPHLEPGNDGLIFTHRLTLPTGETRSLQQARFFAGQPALVLLDYTFFLLRNAPPPSLLEYWAENPAAPVHRLSHRLRTLLRKSQAGRNLDWDELCITHRARPRFVFELNKDKDIVELRLKAIVEENGTEWHWTGQEWQMDHARLQGRDKPEVLEDPRLDAAVNWLRLLDWFTPEPGLWVGDANENFLNNLALAWPSKPEEADYLGNPAFQRLFLAPRRLRPKLVVKGSGIDWLSVSAEWEQEGLRLTKADLERLRAATTRFVKLPNAGWVELDTHSVEQAHETMADLGLDGLNATPTRIGMEQAAALDEHAFTRFVDNPEIKALRRKLENFDGIPDVPVPAQVQAALRPYQRDGLSFLCHLTRIRLGGILADDMGLGKTLQTLTWLAWLHQRNRRAHKPALVICPASVLHNWRREAERFTPHLKVLVLESGAARHRLRKQIPQYDIIVTNYALLRRDWEELEKFTFAATILDEAQFIKNPGAQVTVSVKKLKAVQRLALTGTPLENRLLDLWSITDFVQPGYLGTQEHFIQTYEPKADGEDTATVQRIARRRLSAKLRPLLLRRLKKQVAKDLPDRIEERRDCELGEQQRKLYLAELRRSRDQVLKAVAEKGLAKSKMHVLAALTRLRQICCHPTLVGSDSPSGKTETLFELLEPLLAEGQKVLLFSQFVQMLRLLERECALRQIPTHILTGETKERHQVVQNFQDDPNAAVFLLSLRAAGTGLNLTTASYVVLYDPWWNPAVEAQAIDRSHRIGQTRTVNAYRLITPGTVEEKIYDLQQRKAQTIADVLGEEGFARSLSQTDLEFLFSED